MELIRYLKDILELKDDWKGGIPKDRKNTGKFKCRNNWFGAVNNYVFIGQINNLLTPEILTLFVKFQRNYSKSGFHDRDKTLEDIELTDKLLDAVIYRVKETLEGEPNKIL